MFPIFLICHSDLEISQPSWIQQEVTLTKMQSHFSSASTSSRSSRRNSSVVTGRSFLGQQGVIKTSYGYGDTFDQEDWEALHEVLNDKADSFEVRGLQAQLNAVTDHYLASMPRGQKAIVPARFRLKPNIYR